MRLLSAFLALVLLSFAIPSTTWAFGKKQIAVSDDVIYDLVHRKLVNDPDVKGADLIIEAHNGVVTLRGKVSDKKARAKAEKLTKKVRGVTKVDNELSITP